MTLNWGFYSTNLNWQKIRDQWTTTDRPQTQTPKSNNTSLNHDDPQNLTRTEVQNACEYPSPKIWENLKNLVAETSWTQTAARLVGKGLDFQWILMFSKRNRLKKFRNSHLRWRDRRPTRTHLIPIDFHSALPIQTLFVSLSISHISHCSEPSPTHYCLSITHPSLCMVFVIFALIVYGEECVVCVFSEVWVWFLVLACISGKNKELEEDVCVSIGESVCLWWCRSYCG